MTTIEALNIIELARWHLSDKEKEAIETIKALAMETEEMRRQMQAEDGKMGVSE